MRHVASVVLAATILISAACCTSRASDHVTSEASGPNEVQIKRAEKIVTSLHLTDTAKASRVSHIIAQQYHDLSLIHATRDARIKAAKSATDKITQTAGIKKAQAAATTAQDKLHAEYLVRLTTELSPSQIDAVKDGMTYGVLPLTYGVYQQMLPNLTTEQKAQILAWLAEAREHAMDASTSEEKHAWFGKYKGRINNYLAQAGYDMKAAEKNLHAQR